MTRSGSAYGWDSYLNDFSVLTYGDDVTAIGVIDTDGDGWSELLLLGEPYYEDIYETDPETGELILDENGDPIFIETIFHGRELYTQNWDSDKVISFGYFKYQYPTHSATLDINGDGRADLAVFKDDKLQKIYYSSGRLDFTEMAMDITVGYNIYPGDYNGDGIYEIGCVGYTNYKFGTGHPGYLVNGLIDGLNRKTKIEYAPLTDNSVYTKTSPGAYPLINISAPLYVVDQVTEDDGVGGESITTYNYQDAKVHTQGKGLLGFAELITSNSLVGSTTTNYTINTDYYFTQLASTETKAADDTPVSKVTYGYTTTGTADKRYFNYASSIADENLLTGHKSEKSITYTGNYLTSEIVKINTNESEVHKTYGGHNSEGSPTGISTTYKRDGEDNITRSESYTYLSNGYLETKTIKGLKTKYFYDSFGNVDKVIAGYESTSPRETEFTYTSDGRFVQEEKDPLNRSTIMKYDAWDNVTETEDPNGLKVTNVYDTWGRLSQTTGPDGRSVSTSTLWAGGADKPSGNLAIYYTQVTDEDGDFNGAEYFDAMGRSLRKVGVPYKGKKVYTDATYNNKGQLTEAKGPYPAGTPDNVTTYTYDSKGRIETETLPTSVVITHGYPGGSTVTTSYSTGESYSKTTDGAGLVTSASDPGGTINYEYFADGQAREIQAPGGTVSMTYHTTSGLQHTLNDPDAGTMTYTYNVFGELKTQTDPRGKVTTMEYDDLGRVETKSITGQSQITYIYDENNKLGTLSRITRNSIDEFAYTYDDLMRVLTETRSDGTESFPYEYTYDSDGNVKTLEYPSGLVLTYTYNSMGNLEEIKKGSTSVWKHNNNINSLGQLTGATYGNGKQITYGYDTHDRLNAMTVPNLIDFDYTYNNQNQLTNRTENYWVSSQWKGINETFGYDGVNRLKTASGGESLTMTYKSNPNDRMEVKSDFGTYEYFDNSNHKVEKITGPLISPPEHSLEYTSSGKTKKITEGDKILTLTYGIDDQRFKTAYSLNSTPQYTRYFFDTYEKEIDEVASTTKELNYIYAYGKLVAIYEGNATSGNMHYVYTDYLGSIRCITNASGTIEEKHSFDAWGNRRDYDTGVKLASDPTGMLTARGFTGHEHLDNFGLINMNGRVYDPILGMFLSPDNYVQMPDYTQNFNRYSYGLNNPLMFTDPSGDFVFSLFLGPVGTIIDAACWGAVIGGAGYTATVAFSDGGFNNWSWNQLGNSMMMGAASGVLTAGVGGLFGEVGALGFSHEVGRAMAHMVTQTQLAALTGSADPLTSGLSAGLSSLAGSAFMLYGGRFASSTFGNFAFSGLAGGVGAELSGGDFWEGTTIGLMTAGLNHLQQGLKRPKYDDLFKGYPTDPNDPTKDMAAEDVYKLIGGQVLSEHNRDPHAYTNACALRTSRALNYAGTNIPKIKGQTLVGADGNNYFYRASDLFRWMSKPAVFGNPNYSTRNYSSLSGKGIYIMQAAYPGKFGAWGHATLYNNGAFYNGYVNAKGGVHAFNLWNF